MKRLLKRSLCLLLCLLLCLSLLPQAMAAEVLPNAKSGTCGEGLTWSLSDDGALSISGSGPMKNYTYSDEAPWGTEIKSVSIASGVTSIGDSAFEDCESLSAVTIPASVTSIGRAAFYGCRSLSAVTIPASVTSIGPIAFSECSALGSVTIPAGVTELSESLFSDCSALAEIKLPEGLTKIGDAAFRSCSSLTALSIPGSVKSIGENVFMECAALTSVNIPSGVTAIRDGTFNSCYELKELSIPASVKSIGEYAFYYCMALSSVTIPSGVAILREGSFSHCTSLKSVTIPASVKTIVGSELDDEESDGDEPLYTDAAFQKCSALKDVYYGGTEEQWSAIAIGESGNESLLNAARHCVSAGLPAPQVKGSHTNKGKPSLTWKSVDGAVKYQVARSETGEEGSFKIVKTTEATSFNNSSAVTGKTYYYRVRGVTSDGEEGQYSETVKLTVKLPAPSPSVKLNTKGKPALTWNSVDGAVKYQIYRSKTGKSGSFKRIATVTGTKYTNTKAEAGTTYFYKIRAVSSTGAKGMYSKVVKITARPSAPAVTGKLNAKGKPALTWAAVEGAVKYEVFRSKTGKEGSFKILKTVKTTKYTNSEAASGRTYYYRVRAVTADGTRSDWSEILQITSKPLRPGVRGRRNDKGKPELTWAAVEGAAKYEIWRSTTGEDGSFKRVKTVTGLKYTHSKATKGKTYYYKVRAVTADGVNSAFSAVIKLTAK